MITDLNKLSIQAIVNVFETGRAHGDYGKVTLLSGDSGHLTYGRSQTTLASGNLFLLVQAYSEAESAQFGDALSAFLGISATSSPGSSTSHSMQSPPGSRTCSSLAMS